jgi:triacylglycerol lipase/alpha-L-fucosidase 2
MSPLTLAATFIANIHYGPLPEQVLDACVPARPSPAAIYIHGGGWSGGDKAEFDGMCMALAAKGIAGFAINYRLAPAAYWPAQLTDVDLAAAWVAVNGGAYGASGRVCSIGYSAGAQLSMMLGVQKAVACAVTVSAPTNLVTLAAWDGAMVRNLVGPGGVAAERSASPLDLVEATAASSPILVIQGLGDHKVPPSQALSMAHAMQGMGLPVTLRLNAGGHVLSGLSPAQKAAIEGMIERFVRR